MALGHGSVPPGQHPRVRPRVRPARAPRRTAQDSDHWPGYPSPARGGAAFSDHESGADGEWMNLYSFFLVAYWRIFVKRRV